MNKKPVLHKDGFFIINLRFSLSKRACHCSKKWVGLHEIRSGQNEVKRK